MLEVSTVKEHIQTYKGHDIEKTVTNFGVVLQVRYEKGLLGIETTEEKLNAALEAMKNLIDYKIN